MRLVLVLLLMAGGLLAPAAGVAQPSGRTRIGMLETSARDPARVAWWNVFRDQMRELGYAEGQNVAFETRFADGLVQQLSALAAELVRLKVDVIVTGGAAATKAAKLATATIPIVMATGADPVALGLVRSLASPGANVTGTTSLTSELSGKRLGLLKEIAPGVSRVAGVWAEDNEASAFTVRDTQAAGGTLGLTVRGVGVRRPSDFAGAFSAIARDRFNGVIIAASPTYFAERKRLAELALKHRLPSVVGGAEYAEAGALVSYAPSYPELFRRAAIYVDKILKGAKPADLPVEQPTKFELVVNLKTAAGLGLTVPQAILLRADHVIP